MHSCVRVRLGCTTGWALRGDKWWTIFSGYLSDTNLHWRWKTVIHSVERDGIRQQWIQVSFHRFERIQTYLRSIAQVFHVSKILALNTSWFSWHVTIRTLSSKALWKIPSFMKSAGHVWVIQRWWNRNPPGFVWAWGISPRNYLVLDQPAQPTRIRISPHSTSIVFADNLNEGWKLSLWFLKDTHLPVLSCKVVLRSACLSCISTYKQWGTDSSIRLWTKQATLSTKDKDVA